MGSGRIKPVTCVQENSKAERRGQVSAAPDHNARCERHVSHCERKGSQKAQNQGGRAAPEGRHRGHGACSYMHPAT
ncbi:hypothetical protein NDU88_008108 [Pleurodeles waltl]|uniref:Uncharacterized protein n=1 Tax=Pleurodeles waltl TaxID=8319 RepID=A0AAV7PQX6_PLEWA|nr:hypothetical protein NDU88_008108 [Pleurodeles waltl]